MNGNAAPATSFGYHGGMEIPEDQSATDLAEWNNPENWYGFGLWKVYLSRRDSRIWVPLFWDNVFSPKTINLGHRFGYFTQFLIFWAGIAIAATITWMACHR